MERYTKRENGGNAVIRGDSIYSDCGTPEGFKGDAIDRLAAYEDTGLEPEEIEKANKVILSAFNLAANSNADMLIGRLKEIIQAEGEGRLLVLPCKEESDYAGLKVKYVVVKAETGELVENCFVLRPDKDQAARLALEAYAQATDNQVLASDITSWIGDSGKAIVLPCKVGDTVYYIDGHKSYKAKARTFRFNESGIRVYCERNFMGCIGFEGIYGKTVFLTQEEAETKLKE